MAHRTPPSPFRYFNSSPEVIRLVVLMYVRYPLSLRNVEDLLAERGIEVSYETVRAWWNRFGPMFAAEIRRKRVERMRAFTHWRWRLDEVYVRINGEMHYLWRAVDHPGRAEIGSAPGQVDIAIRLRSAAGPALANRKLGEVGFSIVASPAYLAANDTPTKPVDLARHRIVEVGPPNKARQVELHREGAVSSVRYSTQLHIDDPEAVCVALENDAGIPILPSFLVAAALACGSLVRVLEGWAPAPAPVHVLYCTELAPPLRVKAFVDFLFETISADSLGPPLSSGRLRRPLTHQAADCARSR